MRRDFKIIFQGLFGAGPERSHALFFVRRAGGRRGFKIQPALVNYGEENLPVVNSVTAEHGAAFQLTQAGQLIEDKLFEGTVGHGNRSVRIG